MKFVKTIFLMALMIYMPLYAQNDHKEIGEEFDKNRRFEEINRMRGGEDGINWQLLDRETRLSRLKRLNDEAEIKKYFPTLQTSFADGNLNGHWVEKGSNNQAGRTRFADIDFEEELIYVGTDGGNIFRGTMKGENWTCLNNYIKFNNIKSVRAFKINGNRTIFVAAGNGRCYWSNDEGATWTLSVGLEAIQKWGGVRRAVYDYSNNIYILGYEWDYDNWEEKSVLYFSNDLGKNFKKLFSSNYSKNGMDIWAERYTNDDVLLIKGDSLISYRQGNIITQKHMAQSNPLQLLLDDNIEEGLGYARIYITAAMLEEDNFEIAAAIAYNNATHFYNSEDSGNSWEFKGQLAEQPFMGNSFTSSTYTTSRLFFGSVELYISDSYGKEWKRRNKWKEYYPNPAEVLHADIPAVQLIQDENGDEYMLISTDGGLYISETYGKKVQNISLKGLNCSQYYSCMTATVDTNIIYAGAQDQGFQRARKDEGATMDYLQMFSGDFGSITSSDGGQNLWTVYPTFVLYLPNATTQGKWPTYMRWSYDNAGSGWAWMMPVRAYPTNPKLAYAAGGGANWRESYLWNFRFDGANVNATQINRLFGYNSTTGKLTSLEYDNDNNILLSTDNGWLCKYTPANSSWEDHEITWAGQEKDENFVINAIAVDQSNDDVIYVGGRGYDTPGAFVTFDGGENFIPITEGLPNVHINHLALTDDGKMLFAATSTGPYVFLTWKNQWFDLTTTNSPDQDFRWVEWIEENQVARFATYGRGVWDFRVESFSTEVTEKQARIGFEITSYPNPMTEKINIEFEMPFGKAGTVKIFDIDGREVANLFDGYLQAGTNQFSWNGKTVNGTNLPNGTYLCIASSDGYSAHTKIVIKR